MSDVRRALFFFNAATGEITDAAASPGQRKAQLFLILNRADLFFNEVTLEGKQKVKTSDILAIQKNTLPAAHAAANIIYKWSGKSAQRFLFWAGNVDVDEETLFYDEVPETLLFKGEPGRLPNYRIFVFRRLAGFEIIYYDGTRLYSFFETDETRITERVVALARRFGLHEAIPVLSDIALAASGRLQVDLLPADARYFLLTEVVPLQKAFSNISQDKKLKNIRRLVRRTNTYLNVFLLVLALLLAAQVVLQVSLQRDARRFRDRWNRINAVVETSDRIEREVAEIEKRVGEYPDHSGFLNAIHQALDNDSFLLSFSLLDDRINLEGYARDSLAVLSRLERNPLFERVSFKSPVKKNIYSQTERFYIEILLKKNG